MSSLLPLGWSQQESKSQPGKFYYAHVNGAKTWEVPTADTPTHDPHEGEPSEIRALHILKKHAGSRRPSSWRSAYITQTKEEAVQQIKDIRAQLQECGELNGAVAMRQQFGEVAKVESDCSSAAKYGDLGSFGRGMMQAPFEDAAFRLNVGEMSGVVSTDSGIHIILRVA
jgi:peptidyl-prolyl cis-trans isomerase NIMA-interacting 1